MHNLVGTTGGGTDNAGVFLSSLTGVVTQISREGDAVPGGTFNTFSTFNNTLALNASGQTAFRGFLTGTTGGNSDDLGLFLAGPTGVVTQIVREGDAAPDSGTFSSFNSLVLNASGQTAYSGVLSGTTGGSSDDSGIFLGGPFGGVTQIVREGDAAPDSNGLFSNVGLPALNASGQTAFRGFLTGTTGGSSDDSGIFLGGPTGGVTQILREGDAAPDSNGTFSSTGPLAFNDIGQTAFYGVLSGTTGVSSDDTGLFLAGPVGGVTQIIREGDAAPDSNGTFENLFLVPSLNANGQIAFKANLRDTASAGSDDSGLFVSASGRVLQVAREGYSFAGSTIISIDFLAGASSGGGFNDSGQISYRVHLLDGRNAIVRNTIVEDPDWTNASSGDWDTAGNWEGGIAPHTFHETSINPASSLTVTGPAGPRNVHTLDLGTSAGGPTELVLQNEFSSTNGITIGSMGKLTLSGQIVKGVMADVGAKLGGVGMVIGPTVGPDVLFEPSGGSFIHSGPLDLGTQNAAVVSSGFANLGSRTTMAGGTLFVPNGLFLQGATSLEGEGSVQGKVAAAFGSTIRATGATLVLGDANSLVGFHSDGELYTGGNTVEIFDKNEAVLGSLTQLGDGASGANLVAGGASVSDTHDHFLLREGNNITGRGNIAGHFKNQGTALGDGTDMTERLIFDAPWTVSGIGTFENTLVEGTFAPGNSPVISTGNNQGFGGTIEIELGGTTPGSGPNNHDQIVDAGEVLLLDGTDLAVMPWNGFEPAIGDTFDFLQANDGIVGTFDDLFVDPFFLDLGIGFELAYDGGTATLLAVAGLPGDFDFDNDVDGGDFLAWQRNGSGSDDLADWQDNYGQTSALAASNTAVPEPTTAVLLLLTGLFSSARRRENSVVPNSRQEH